MGRNTSAVMNVLLGALLLISGLIALVVLGAFLVARTRLSHDGQHGTSGGLSGALLEVQSLLEPGKKNTVETLRRDASATDEDRSGDPPKSG